MVEKFTEIVVDWWTFYILLKSIRRDNKKRDYT